MKVKVRKQDSGITLIALVITIIVLLILAGVSIAMLTGDNGILTQAQGAKEQSTAAGEKEQIQLAYAAAKAEKLKNKDNTDVVAQELSTAITADDIKATVEENRNPAKITFTDTGNIYAVVDGEVKGPIKPLKAGDTALVTIKDNYEDINKDKATIPAGFTVSTTDNTISKGLVVTAPDGSEFVWVPVPTVVSDTEANGTTNKAMAIDLNANTEGAEPKYRGLLYNFTGTSSSVIEGCTTTTDSYREPDNLATSYDNSTNVPNWTSTMYQNEYNAMIEKVIKYGGFYVGRYETSISGGTVASKPTEPMSGATDSQKWYGMYDKQKNYASSNEKLKNVVGSSMIWGSQYDAIMNWALNGEDKTKVTANIEKHDLTTTGGTPTDIINNIYDLGNNLREWTLEANSTFTRVDRGGNYGHNSSPKYRNEDSNPKNTFDGNGSRITLYII